MRQTNISSPLHYVRAAPEQTMLLPPQSLHKVYCEQEKFYRKAEQHANAYRLSLKYGWYRTAKMQTDSTITIMEELCTPFNYNSNKHNNNKKQNSNMEKQLTRVIGTICDNQGQNYNVSIDEKTIYIPFKVMHSRAEFPVDILENGKIKIGTDIVLFQKDEETYYPDHSVYCTPKIEKEAEKDGSYLLDGVEAYKVASTLKEAITKYNHVSSSLSESTRMDVLEIIASNLSDDEKCSRICDTVKFPLDFVESRHLEKKKSLFYSAGKSHKSGQESAQMQEIIECLVAMCNCRDQKPSKLIVGVDDKNNHTSKLQNEIASRYPNMSLDQIQNTVLGNSIRSYTYNNALLMQSLEFHWYTYNGDLILVIETDYHGDPIICKGGILPYKSGSSKSIAQGLELIPMIKCLLQDVA
jgi:hypothetical protein